jgi:threonine synthase
MFYESTRGGMKSVLSAEAIKRGIAPDGGLFVPETGFEFTLEEIGTLTGMNYRERAVFILKNFLDDYTLEEITDCVNKSYTSSKFDSDDIAPVYKLNILKIILPDSVNAFNNILIERIKLNCNIIVFVCTNKVISYFAYTAHQAKCL